MKDSIKQTILTALCIIIVFIPTYIAIAYYGIKSAEDAGNRYAIEITDHTGEEIRIDLNEVDSLAKIVLKMNSKLTRAGGIDANTLPQKYYDIKVFDNGSVSSYRYYFSSNPNNRTLVSDDSGSFYSLEFKHVKAFLSKECAYTFYDTSVAPTLSINGGEDILPTNAEWEYRAADGTYIHAPLKTALSDSQYAMSGKNRLKFSVSPSEYSIKVYKDGKLLEGDFDLSSLPYDLLDNSSLRFVITAEWSGLEGCRGTAKYSFSTSIGKAPEFAIAANTTLEGHPDNTVLMGEFFTVVGANVSAPQKIEFTSEPMLDFTPTFFSNGELVYALIPIPNDKNAPLEYTFRFSYSGATAEFKVNAVPRSVKSRDYSNCDSINASRNSGSVDEYKDLLKEIGTKYEDMRYFGSDSFIDYETYYGKNDATIILGYGNERVPDNEDEAFILDGVDYGMPSGLDVRAISAGKVVYSGSCELLGSFVVVDHGYGLKTWYCHLSNSIVTVGETVQKGAVIGSSGKTGYTNSNGVYLITTVGSVPICPYSMQEKGIIFSEPNT